MTLCHILLVQCVRVCVCVCVYLRRLLHNVVLKQSLTGLNAVFPQSFK